MLVTVKARKNRLLLTFHGPCRTPQLLHTPHGSPSLSALLHSSSPIPAQVTSQGPSDSPVAQNVSACTQHSHSLHQTKLTPSHPSDSISSWPPSSTAESYTLTPCLPHPTPSHLTSSTASGPYSNPHLTTGCRTGLWSVNPIRAIWVG